MEAVLLHSSPDQSFSTCKQQIRKNKNSNRTFIHRRSDNFPASDSREGLLQSPSPPFLFHSFPPPVSLRRQPPLLPLPVTKPHSNHLGGNRGLSCPPPDSENHSNRTKDQPVKPKKSKPSINSPRKDKTSKPKQPKCSEAVISESESFIISSTNRLGPEPEDLPKVVSKVLSSSQPCVVPATPTTTPFTEGEKFSGSAAFTESPPPSSLPLPTFFLKPKLSCNAEAAGIDTGATDSLRRLLRLM